MHATDTKAVVSPLTGTANVQFLESYATDQLIDDWKARLGIDISEEFSGIAEVQRYRCLKSGIEFFWPPTVAGSNRLYEKLQEIDWYYQDDKWEHRVALKDLQGASRILEVGAGRGAFVARALEEGFDIQGVDTNQRAVEAARQAGLPVSCISVNQLETSGEKKFDAICCFQVLEHIQDPSEFIEQLLALLKPGGSLIFSVPNQGGYLRYENNILNMPPHHMTRWTTESFRQLQNLYPLKLEKVRYEPLDPLHISAWVDSRDPWLLEHPFPWRWLLRPSVLRALRRKWLRLGLRHLMRGHTLSVCFRPRKERG